MAVLNRLPFVEVLSEQFLWFLKNDLLWFHLFDKSIPLIFQMCIMRRNSAYLCPNMINFNVVYFSERHSEEGDTFVLTLSVVLQDYSINQANMTQKWKLCECHFIFFLQGTSWMWLGLHDRTAEDLFEWSDGSNLTYTLWLQNQPNVGSDHEDCVLLRSEDDYGWRDVPCSGWQVTESFICKLPQW